MLAEVAGRLRRYADAEELLERCLKLAPSFDAARHNYAVVLNRQAKPAAALPHVDQLLAKEPRNPGYPNLKAAILANLGDYRGSIEIYQSVLRDYPHQPKIWMSYGHALKTEGRQEESIAAYRRAIAHGADAGRGVLEPRQPQDVPLLAADDVQAMRRRLRARIWATRIGCISSSRSARRSRTRARTRTRSRTTPRQRAAPQIAPVQRR